MRPDIAYAVHQCARFCSTPKRSHGDAVRLIGRYLLGTAEKGLIMHPTNESFDCYVDASHTGKWNQENAKEDETTTKSRSGYIITYGNCPILWASKMQTEIALSSTEAEYIALSQSLREIIPLTALIQEAKTFGINITSNQAKLHCKLFEDNTGAAELAKVPKMRPRTKHLNIKYHHFRKHVSDGLVSIHTITTEQQIADIFTKPLNQSLFAQHRKWILGW